jgi:hypothetical protein
MVPLGKLSVTAAALLLLIQCPSRANAEDAVSPAASQPAAEAQADDILGDGTKDPVAEVAKQREEEARANARQAIDALNRWLVEELESGRYTGRSLDIQQWIRDLDKVKRAIDEGKPLDEANRMAKEFENEILRKEQAETEARHGSGDCESEAKTRTLPEGDEKEDVKENVHSKLVRVSGRLRAILELAELVMSLTSCNQ